MFFKKSDETAKKAADIAVRSTFIFWGSILFINSLCCGFIIKKPIISEPSTLLICGLIVFFVTDLIVRLLNRKTP